MMSQQCSAWRAGLTLCSNGFPQNGACMGATCHGCGRPPQDAPACMRDEVPAHLIDEAGRMRFADDSPVGADRRE